jgi:deoxyribose-phosphate aldolase
MALKQDELTRRAEESAALAPSSHGLGEHAPVTLHGRRLEPNRRMRLNLDWVEEVRVNTSAVERRASTIGTRRSVNKDWQAAWLLRAIACMDLTVRSA